jgi:hypothetical protein
MEKLNYVQQAYSEDIEDGYASDVLLLRDGTVLLINADAVLLYPSIDALENTQKGTVLGIILRSQARARSDSV